MLNGRERNRIREEEIYRSAVREEIAELSTKTTGKKFYGFLNSPFGLWILTSIILGLFSFGYTQYQRSKDTQQRIQKIDAEILARIRSARMAFYTNSDRPFKEIADILCAPPGRDGMIQVEFADSNLESLLYELKRLVPDDDTNISNAIVVQREIRDQVSPGLKDPAAKDTVIFRQIDELGQLRWYPQIQHPPKIPLIERVGPAFYPAIVGLVAAVISIIVQLFTVLRVRRRQK